MTAEAVGNQISPPPYALAMEIIDRAWLEKGVTREELAYEERVADLFDRWLAAGHAPEEFVPPAQTHAPLLVADGG